MEFKRQLSFTALLGMLLFAAMPRIFAERATAAAEPRIAQIAAMVQQGSSRQRIVTAWEDFFRVQPKTNVGWAVSYLQQEVRRLGAEKVQQARLRVASTKAQVDSVKTKLAAARRQQGDATQQSVKNLEAKLQTVGDDAQLANVDLQNTLQQQQQALQMLSNISKLLNDTANAVIRKIGG